MRSLWCVLSCTLTCHNTITIGKCYYGPRKVRNEITTHLYQWYHKDVFDCILKLLAISKNVNFEDSNDSPILNREAINLFCEFICMLILLKCFIWLI